MQDAGVSPLMKVDKSQLKNYHFNSEWLRPDRRFVGDGDFRSREVDTDGEVHRPAPSSLCLGLPRTRRPYWPDGPVLGNLP